MVNNNAHQKSQHSPLPRSLISCVRHHNHACWSLITIIGICSTILLFHYSSTPYLYLAVLGVMICLYATAAATRPWIKAMWFNLGVIILVLGGAELYCAKVFFANEPQHED